MGLQLLKNQATIEYPESDGLPMGETDRHIQAIVDLRQALRGYFVDRSDVYIGSNLLVYYDEGDPRKYVVPDVFVVRDAKTAEPRIWKIWEEGTAPELVIEISSRGTWGDDLQRKWRLSARMGVREYYIFDPDYDYLDPPLLAYRLQDGEYDEMDVPEGRIHSAVLGLDLVDTGRGLRILDPVTETFLLTPAEEGARRKRLEEKLRELGVDPDQL